MIKSNFPKRAVAMRTDIWSFDVYANHTEKELLSIAGFKGGMMRKAWIVEEREREEVKPDA